MNDLVIKRLEQVKKTIPPQVNLIAVTKKVSPEIMKTIYEQGVRDFAENKLQEALDKQNYFQEYADICWHFIGHLQTNKAKKAIENFAWIHSVDSLKLAKRLDFYSQKALSEKKIKQLPQVCLQVKIVPDEKKYGWSIEDLYQDLSDLQQLTNLHFRGLMVILPLGLSSSETLATFNKAHQLAQDIRAHHYFAHDFDQLSMGMSGDYLLAIEAGATMIRLGSIIFSSCYK